MSNLFNNLVKLGNKNPGLRGNISPVLNHLKKESSRQKSASSLMPQAYFKEWLRQTVMPTFKKKALDRLGRADVMSGKREMTFMNISPNQDFFGHLKLPSDLTVSLTIQSIKYDSEDEFGSVIKYTVKVEGGGDKGVEDSDTLLGKVDSIAHSMLRDIGNLMEDLFPSNR